VTPAAAIAAHELVVHLGGRTVLSDVSFEIPDGSALAIVGPNGSGKSTLLRAMLGLLPAAGGRVRIFDREPRALPPEWIGYVPQVKTMDRTFPGVAVELVVTGLTRRWPWRVRGVQRERAVAALDEVGAAALADHALATLSGGELQRVYLARALVRRPRLIVLDEPASGLDPTGEERMRAALHDYRTRLGATVVIVTHDLQTALAEATHVLLLRGRQVSFGTPSEALAAPALREAYGVTAEHVLGGPGAAHA